ncbi:hypothetical protein MMC11_007101 [Xylographa trunciseda]|nr:hypothetical protein [Xylographa trunciseda]
MIDPRPASLGRSDNMSYVNLLLFGDQTVEKLSSIQSLVRHSKTSPAASTFLRQATDIVQLDFFELSSEDRGWPHEIHTLLGLAEENVKQKEPNGIMATVLMCIGRLGELIVYAEEDPSILGSEGTPIEILAFCTGLLPAAAAAAARDTSELLKIAIEVVSITFRMAFEISRRMKLVEGTGDKWATTIVGYPLDKAQDTLDNFHKTQNIPEPRRLAIGVVAKGWFTIIGPPSSLTRLWAYSPDLDRAAKIPTDTNGPIHTSHMPRINVEKVLGHSSLLDIPISSKARIASNSSSGTYSHSTLRSLLAHMITDIAHNVLYLTNTLDECISGLADTRKVRLTVVGPTGHLPTVQSALKDAGIKCDVNSHLDAKVNRVRGGSDLVAIVGMAGRFPGSETIDRFWEDLLEGKNQIKKVPKSRFDLDVFYDSTGKTKNSTTSQYGSFLDRPGLFDNRLFNISPREAAQMDPIQRWLLTTSYEALESAGYSANASLATESNRIATYFGQTGDDWHEILNNEGIDIYYVPSLARAFGPSRLNYQYKWGGGSYAVDSACATSTTAVSLACSALIARECDTALAGGGSILVSPNSFSGLSRSGMISTTGGCRTYHDDADGYARGEGVGVVVLKRLEDAVGENDNILGVIRGSARVYSSTATSITHPDSKTQIRLYEEVLRQTSVDSRDISYVEMHGTGTQAGDAEEMTSVLQTFGASRTKDYPLTVGAVKANVGHGEAAAGVTSLIKVLMMLRERKIPPQPGMPFKVNHNFPALDKINVRIAGKNMTLKPRPGGDGKIRVLLNSFDASGGNTSLLIEAAPEKARKVDDPRPYHIITLSGRTVNSLQENSNRLLDYLTRYPDTKLADLAYTTSARRMHQVVRRAYTAGSINEVTRFLRADVAKEATNPPRNAIFSRILVFTGQGSQYAGMGKELYQQSTTFRAVLSTYQDMAESQGLPPFVDLICDGQLDITIQSAARVHLAIVALEIAIAHMLKIWGVQPDLVLGHSLGEYAALCVAGVLSVSDTLHLVGQRALLIERKLTPGTFAMLAVRVDVTRVRGLLQNPKWRSCEVACINTPSTTVVSGTLSEIKSLQQHLEAEGTRTTLLNIPYGFHSKQIEPILSKFEDIAKGVLFLNPIIPIASTLTGTIVEDPHTFSASYLARQAREAVNFVGALQACEKAGFSTERTSWIEVGPDSICSGLIRTTLDTASDQVLSILKSSESNWKTISSTLAAVYKSGTSLNWPEYHKDFKYCLSLLDLPRYAFDEKEYWTSYSEPERTTVIIDSAKRISEPPTSSFVPGFPTTSLQRVESEDMDSRSITASFASNVSDPHLFTAIQGHVVDGITVCPLSIFCDMALSASHYAYSRLRPGKRVPKMSLCNIDLTHPLIVPEKNLKQIAKVTASYSLDSNTVSITFSSNSGKTDQEHGLCQVVFGNNDEHRAQLSQTLFLIGTRIDSLKNLASVGKAHRLLKPVVYKLFANLVAYGENYKALEEVILDSDCHDAVGTVKLPALIESGQFLFNPYWLDAAVHLAGFLLNGSLKYSDDIACLSTGFDSYQIFEELSAQKIYTSYVCMQETGKNSMIVGDCFVFEGSKLVLATMGIKFQKMKKVVLNSILRADSLSSNRPSKVAISQVKNNTSNRDRTRGRESIVHVSNDVTHFPLSRSPSTSSSSKSVLDDDASTPGSSIGDTGEDLVSKLLSIVAAESGYDLEEMNDDTVFTDMGLDSLMGITISSILKRDMGVELPGTFFMDNQTLREAKAALGLGENPKVTTSYDVDESDDNPDMTRVPSLWDLGAVDIISKEELLSLPKENFPVITTLSSVEVGPLAKIMVLQGIDSPEATKLFLLPDGSGSPASYIQLPSLGSNVCVYGVESPFVKEPSKYVCSADEMANSFMAAIVNKQPSGPYMVGGISFGALYAYEVARKLLGAGEQVMNLLLIDMALPKAVDISVEDMMRQLEETGRIPPPSRQSRMQKEHMRSTVKAFIDYIPIPMSPDQRPGSTVLISAGGNSTTRDWEDLVGEVQCHDVIADHLALLRYPTVKTLGQICRDAVSRFGS